MHEWMKAGLTRLDVRAGFGETSSHRWMYYVGHTVYWDVVYMCTSRRFTAFTILLFSDDKFLAICSIAYIFLRSKRISILEFFEVQQLLVRYMPNHLSISVIAIPLTTFCIACVNLLCLHLDFALFKRAVAKDQNMYSQRCLYWLGIQRYAIGACASFTFIQISILLLIVGLEAIASMPENRLFSGRHSKGRIS